MEANNPLRILIVEDVPSDAELAERELRKDAIQFTSARVDTEEGFLKALKEFQPHLIISDYAMPEFDGMQALRLSLEHDAKPPFIVLTGSMNEETAVACMKAGATDYVIKDHLAKLPFAVREALEKKKFFLAKEAADQALLKSEERYRDLVENSQDLICTHDLEGKLLSVNEAPLRALGYSREFLLQVKMKDLLTPEQHEQFGAYLKEIKEKGRATGILRLQTATGETRYWEYNNTLRTEGVSVPIVRGIAHDVTERRTAELALRKSEERYRLHFENVSDVIFSYDREFRITSISPSLERILGYKPEEFVGKSFAELNILPPESLEKVLSDVKRVFSGERLDSLIYKLIARDGTIKYGEFSSTPLIREGQVVAVVSVGRDITERKRMEEALRGSEEKYRLIAENSNDWIYLINPDGKFQYVSPSSERLTGYPPVEFINNPGLFLDIIHPGDQERVKSHFELVQEETEPHQLEFRMITKENELFWISHSCLPVHNEQGQYVGRSGTNRDITERKQGEEKLSQTLENLRKAMGGIIQVISATVETRDPYTAGHQRRTANLARAIAVEIGLAEDQRDGLLMAGTIHDLGKISIPAEILSKPTKLSEIEYQLIQGHPQIGYDILKEVEFPWPVAEVVLQHHERMNGSGYPQGLKGEDISLEARILMVADVVEAIASHRPYRPALGIGAALEEIEKNKGILYDTRVVEACLGLFREKGFGFE